MYITTNNAPATASITHIIADHTGSFTLSSGRNNRFICEMVPNVANRICELGAYR
jgi:hypothetical protein